MSDNRARPSRLLLLILAAGTLVAVVWAGRRLASRTAAASTRPSKAAPSKSGPAGKPTEGFFEPDLTTAGSIRGKVLFIGVAPEMRVIDMSADPTCVGLRSEDPAREETVVVNENGTLRNVLVYVKRGLEGKKFDPPSRPVLLDQVACRFRPHVFGVMAGQPIIVRNSDDTTHNIQARPRVNEAFNFGQPKKGLGRSVVFDRPEVMVPITNDQHFWMSAYCGVLAHPYFAVTGENGSFVLKNLPPGEYEIDAWHEKYGAKTRKATLGEKRALTLDFTFFDEG